MSLLGGFLGAIGGLLGFEGQQSANDAQMEMLERQIEWQREVLQNKIQWQTQDYRDAGLNPVLAATQGASGSAPSASAPQVGNTVLAATSSAAAIANIVNQFRQTDNDTRKVDSEIQVNSARAEQANQEANFRRALIQVGFPEAQTAHEQASAFQAASTAEMMFNRIDEIKVGIQKTNAEIKNLESLKVVYEAQAAMYRANANDANAAAALKRVQAQLTEIDKKLHNQYLANEELRAEGLEIENKVKSLGVPKAEAEERFYSDPRVIESYKRDPWSFRRDKGYGLKLWGGPSGIGVEYGLR